MVRRHEDVSVLVGHHLVAKGLLVIVEPGSHTAVEQGCDAQKPDRCCVHFLVEDGWPTPPIRQSESIGRVEDDHVDQSDWEEDGQPWSEQECDPRESDQERVLLEDLELGPRVELHVPEQRLLARALGWEFAAAPSLVKRALEELDRPLADKLCGREESLDAQHREHLIPDISEPILVEVPINPDREEAHNRYLQAHRRNQVKHTVVHEEDTEYRYYDEADSLRVRLKQDYLRQFDENGPNNRRYDHNNE